MKRFVQAAIAAMCMFAPTLALAQSAEEVARLRAVSDLQRSQIIAHGEAIARISETLMRLEPVIAGMPVDLQRQLAQVKSDLQGEMRTAATGATDRGNAALAALEGRVKALLEGVGHACAKFADAATQTKCLDLEIKGVEVERAPHDNVQGTLNAVGDALRVGMTKEWSCKQIAPAGAGNTPPAEIRCGWKFSNPTAGAGNSPVITGLPPGTRIHVTHSVGPSAHAAGEELDFDVVPPELPPALRAKAYLPPPPHKESSAWSTLGPVLGAAALGAIGGCGIGGAVSRGSVSSETVKDSGCGVGAMTGAAFSGLATWAIIGIVDRLDRDEE